MTSWHSGLPVTSATFLKAVFGDDDGEAAELVVAVRKAGGLHGVRDEEDLVDGLHLEGEGDHVGAEVDLVADHLDVGLVVIEARADHADFAVVELRHLVAEMRQAAEALRLAGLVLLHGGRRVAAGRDDAGLHKLRGERDGAFRLDGVGDDGDFGDGVKAFDFIEIGLAEIGGVLGADAVRIDVGAFQMGADDFRAGRLLAVGFDVLQGGGELVFGERQRRGAEGGHAFLDLGFRDDLHGFFFIGRRLVAHAAVDMEIVTASACLTSGSDAVILRHPTSVKTIAAMLAALA